MGDGRSRGEVVNQVGGGCALPEALIMVMGGEEWRRSGAGAALEVLGGCGAASRGGLRSPSPRRVAGDAGCISTHKEKGIFQKRKT